MCTCKSEKMAFIGRVGASNIVIQVCISRSEFIPSGCPEKNVQKQSHSHEFSVLFLLTGYLGCKRLITPIWKTKPVCPFGSVAECHVVFSRQPYCSYENVTDFILVDGFVHSPSEIWGGVLVFASNCVDQHIDCILILKEIDSGWKIWPHPLTFSMSCVFKSINIVAGQQSI